MRWKTVVIVGTVLFVSGFLLGFIPEYTAAWVVLTSRGADVIRSLTHGLRTPENRIWFACYRSLINMDFFVHTTGMVHVDLPGPWLELEHTFPHKYRLRTSPNPSTCRLRTPLVSFWC
jgi:hypothetical protein